MAIGKYDTRKVANEGVELTLLDPETLDTLFCADKTPMTIKLLGVDSDRYRKAEHEITDRRLSIGGKRKVTAKEIEQGELHKMVAVTVEWNIEIEDGKKLDREPDAAMVREVYTNYPWVRAQVEEFVNSRSNFVKASTTN